MNRQPLGNSADPLDVWTRSRVMVAALMCGISMIAYVQRLSISVLERPMSDSFSLDVRQASWLVASFAWGYALFQISSGWLTDVWGPRRMLTAAATVWSILLAAIGTTSVLWTACVLSLGAFGSAFAGVAAFTVAMDIGRERTGTVFGMMNTCGNVGAAISPVVAGEVIARTGNWNLVVASCAGLYMMSTLCWIVIKPGEELVGERTSPEHTLLTAPLAVSFEPVGKPDAAR